MKRAIIFSLGIALVLMPIPGGASHNADIHSDNVKLVTTWDDGGTYRSGSDIAFWKNRAVFGNLNPGGFRLMNIKKPKNISEIGQFTCVGSQADVSIWQNLVFVSVDATLASDACDSAPATPAQVTAGTHWEGVRVVSIADPFNPQQIAAVNTDCGSHTHTLIPDLDYVDPATGAKAPRLILYVLSYPLGGQGAKCNLQSHRKISVIEVLLSNPAGARVIGTPSVAPAVGCHDVTYFEKRQLAGAACISESQLWDVSNPASPRILSHIENPEINIHHSSGFSWDGNTMILGDELGGATVSPGCGDQGDAPTGALWFYDVKDPANPEEISHYKIPQQDTSDLCTAHNFNVVPLRKQRDILVSAWYNGGTTIVDFTNPEAPTQIGYYIPKTGLKATTWSSYWYNGRIYVNNYEHGTQSRGIDILQIKHGFAKRAIDLPHLNAQTQQPFKIPKKKKR
jgi:hypothetical protein